MNFNPKNRDSLEDLHQMGKELFFQIKFQPKIVLTSLLKIKNLFAFR